MSISYNLDIPDAPNNPSNDQPLMKINTNAIDSILAIDHISFNTANSGNHQQMHLPSFTNPSVVNGSATEGSVIYSAAGTADVTRAQIFYKNAFGDKLPISPIKAFGAFDGAGTLLNGINISLTSHVAGSGVYVLAIPVNILTGTNYSVLISSNFPLNGVENYVINSATSLTVTIGLGTGDPTQFSVAILQI